MGASFDAINAHIETINDFVNDKRFDGGAGTVSQEELSKELRLGSRTNAFKLWLVHTNRLLPADKRAGGTGGVQYAIA